VLDSTPCFTKVKQNPVQIKTPTSIMGGMNAWRNSYDIDAIYEYGSPGNCPLLRYNVWAAWRPTYVFKKATWTLRRFNKVRGSRRNPCMMHMRRAQHEDVHSTTISTNKYKQRGTWHLGLHAWQCKKMARSVFTPCPYFRDLHGRKLKGILVIIPKVGLHGKESNWLIGLTL